MGNATQGWTLDTLKAHLCNKLDNLERMLNEREAFNVERFAAFKKAEASLRQTYEVQHKLLVDRVDANTNRLTTIETSLAAQDKGVGWTGFMVMGAFSVLASMVSVITLVVHVYKP